jgi:uncharacterized membrane protein SirB2
LDYYTLKHFHMGCAAVSGSLFLLRGVWMLRASPSLQQRWVKVAPHLVDTLLLGSAITLAAWSGQYPFVQGWLTAKVVALLGYIVLGTIALKRGRTRTVRTGAFIGALTLFGYIAAVAVSKHPNPFSSAI